MPSITDPPPQDIAAELADLSTALDADIPAKALDRNLLIATWNLRMFGDLTEKWKAGETDSPKRDLHALLCIKDIISRFDVIAVQEVRGNIKCLRHLMKVIGPHWNFILTDVTKGDSGNDERMAFLFDTRKVQMSGLACELVVPLEELRAVAEGTLDKQFARTPYAASFRSGGKTFILVTLHVLYGRNAAERLPEIRAIAKWMAEWARDINGLDQNLIVLGDFNIDRKDDVLYQAFTSTGLQTPQDLNNVPRTIFDDPANSPLNKFYDQVAWFTSAQNVPALSLKYSRGGFFDFTKVALKSRNLTNQQLSFRISDHYPLWAEFFLRD